PRFSAIGFGLPQPEDGSWQLTAAPSLLGDTAPLPVLLNLLEEVEADELLNTDSYMSPVALSMARSAAIPAGRKLSAAEADSLLADLFRCLEPGFTPDGNVVVSTITHDDLRKRFL
ncbi:MAG: hypothetical protein K2F79_04250, partial [Muribaculaceae bacterium]|nr:hypothetical protein [Muribaculaceae bacterium]